MEQVDRFLDRGYDVLLVNIVDRTAAAVLIDKAEAAGVPVIFFNRQPVAEDIDYRERVYYVGARAEESGALQGKLVLDAWRDEVLGLDRNGDGVLQYVMLEGEPGHQDSLLRTEWSVKTLTDAGVAVEKLDGDAANWNRGQAAAKMAQWLDEFGDGIEVVFSNNDDMALGAIDAIRAREGFGALVVGVDGTAPALEAVASGELYGTILNNGKGIAKAMLDLALALADGRDPAQAVDLEVCILLAPFRDGAGKGALLDNPVLPGQREDVGGGHVVDFEGRTISAGNPPRFFVHTHSSNPHHIGSGSQSGFQLLHLVGLDGKVVCPAHAVEKFLLRCALQRDFDLLIEQQVGPVLRHFLCHTHCVPAAVHVLEAVVHLVAVETSHIPVVPGLPDGDIPVESGGHR